MQRNVAEQGKGQADRSASPVVLELGDGSKLVLEDASASRVLARADVATGECISLEDATRGCGQPFAGYRRLKD